MVQYARGEPVELGSRRRHKDAVLVTGVNPTCGRSRGSSGRILCWMLPTCTPTLVSARCGVSDATTHRGLHDATATPECRPKVIVGVAVSTHALSIMSALGHSLVLCPAACTTLVAALAFVMRQLHRQDSRLCSPWRSQDNAGSIQPAFHSTRLASHRSQDNRPSCASKCSTSSCSVLCDGPQSQGGEKGCCGADDPTCASVT